VDDAWTCAVGLVGVHGRQQSVMERAAGREAALAITFARDPGFV
jgi:hypothetical protein